MRFETHLAVAVSVLCDLAGQNVSEGGECIVHRLVVNRLIQVLDEHVADTGPEQGKMSFVITCKKKSLTNLLKS